LTKQEERLREIFFSDVAAESFPEALRVLRAIELLAG
jgi:hypothetical protein